MAYSFDDTVDSYALAIAILKVMKYKGVDLDNHSLFDPIWQCNLEECN